MLFEMFCKQRPHVTGRTCRYARPVLEVLENRLLLAQSVDWTGGAVKADMNPTSSWTEGRNWNETGKPQGTIAVPSNNGTVQFLKTTTGVSTLNQAFTGMTLNIDAASTIGITLQQPLQLAGGTMAGGSIFAGANNTTLEVASGIFNLTGGTIGSTAATTKLEVDGGATLNISGTVTLQNTMFVIDTDGTVNFSSGSLFVNGTSSINNNGTFTLGSTNGIAAIFSNAQTAGALPIFDNSGTLTTAGTTGICIGFTNDGKIQVNGTITFSAGLTDWSAIVLNQGSTLNLGPVPPNAQGNGAPSANYTYTFNPNTEFTAVGNANLVFTYNTATYNFPVINLATNVTLPANLTLTGFYFNLQGADTLTVQGTTNLFQMLIQQGATLTIAPGATATLDTYQPLATSNVNVPSRQMTLLGGSAGSTGTIQNQGILKITAATTVGFMTNGKLINDGSQGKGVLVIYPGATLTSITSWDDNNLYFP